MREDSHRELRESLGAYVLGHLDPAEQDAVASHWPRAPTAGPNSPS